MFQIDDPTAASVMPTPEAAGTQGWFTEGNPATNTPATNVRASFLNGLTKELMNILAEMGTTPSKTTYTQLRDSIYAMIAVKAIGYGQTWTDVKASRAINTTYTNSTGRTIMVAASVKGNTANSTLAVSWTIAGVTGIAINNSITGATPTNTELQATVVIPPGATYQLVVTQGTLDSWVELR